MRALLILCLALPAMTIAGESDILPLAPSSTPRPAAAIEETDSVPGVTPKGLKDDRQLAKTPKTSGNPDLDELLREAKRTGEVRARWITENGGRQWYSATPDGWLKRIADPLAQNPPRREVAVPQPFRSAGPVCEFDPDHVCNRCGTTQLVIAKWNADGTHSHKCPRCGHSWRH